MQSAYLEHSLIHPADVHLVPALTEPPYDKTNNVAVLPAKTQISPGIRPAWSVFAVRLMGS